MKYQHNVSTNIVRDERSEINFIVTPNTREIFKRIFLTNNGANKSFNLIGNYGTGKSTFLWALEKNLNGEKFYFDELSNKNNDAYQFVKLIGDASSFSTSIKKILKININSDSQDIIDRLEVLRLKASKGGKGFILVIDEFGKYLEFANKQQNLDELYLIQQIAEWANDDSKNIFFIISLHQNFANYGKNLSANDKLEWEKVKGRFIELLFNEPVEQLLYFASKRLKEFVLPKEFENRFSKLNVLIQKSKLSSNIEINAELTESLYPLDWLSANVLVNSLQRYGQNERSLFSFLNDSTKYSIREDVSEFYTVSKVFDYLVNNLTTEINSFDNPHRPQWYSAFRAIERAELYFDAREFDLALRVIKTINLVNIFSKAGGLFDKAFIIDYFILTEKVDASNIIEILQKASIIRFYKHSNKINFFEGTDIDLEQELISIAREINPDFSITEEINSLINFPILTVKEYSFKTGTPRFFEFKILRHLGDVLSPEGSIDGFINLVFDKFSTKEILNVSNGCVNNIFVLYKNSSQIKSEVFTIKKFNLLLEKHQQDRNALKILSEERLFHVQKLEHLILKDLFVDGLNEWIYNGSPLSITGKNKLYEKLTNICADVYSKTPKFINELVNKEFLSPPINSARKALTRKILENETIKDLGFDENKFPPEKAIYISLLNKTGIHKYSDQLGYYQLSQPSDDSPFYELWQECESFIRSALSSKRNLNELYDILKDIPYKLKRGLVDFWVPIFLIAKREDFALFHITGGFIPYITEEIIDLIHRSPESFLIKSYDVSGLKINLLESYKDLVQVENKGGIQTSFLAIFGNFLRFHRGLNSYTLKTNKLSKKAISLRSAIASAKDPEDALFTQFPIALGYESLSFKEDIDLLQSFTDQLQDAIREIRVAYDELISRIEFAIREAFLCKETDFEKYKEEIVDKLRGINQSTLAPKQSIFLKRVISPLDDRISWIKSVADVAIGKSIEEMIDSEESILMESIRDFSLGLIKANEVQSYNQNNNDSKLLSFRFFGESGEIFDNKLLISNKKNKEVLKTTEVLNQTLKQLEPQARKEILLELLSYELTTI